MAKSVVMNSHTGCKTWRAVSTAIPVKLCSVILSCHVRGTLELEVRNHNLRVAGFVAIDGRRMNVSPGKLVSTRPKDVGATSSKASM
jgi:hypothetical protein